MALRRTSYALVVGLLMVALAGCYLPVALDSGDGGASGEPSGGAPVTEQNAAPTVPARQTAPTATAPVVVPAPAIGSLAGLQSEIEAVYAAASPAVVNITSRVIQFDWFNQPVPQEGTGSGFLWDASGHIVTNYHVIADATEITVAFSDGQDYPAELVGQDASTDLAVLHVDADALPSPLTLADSDALRVGQFVLAIGNPFGLDLTMTFGIISSLGRVIETPNARFLGEAIQTDAPINPGNSGGPLLDLEARVIGVNSQIISTSESSSGIGFAVSSNTVRRVVPELISHGSYPHPWLGVSMMGLTPERVRVLNDAGASIPVEEGVLVLEVQSGSPAERAGLRGAQQLVVIQRTRVPVGGDIITQIDGQAVASEKDLMLLLDTQTQVGQEVTVTFLRGRETMTATFVLEARPEE